MQTTELASIVQQLTGAPPTAIQAVAGGDISPAWRIQTDRDVLFMKSGSPQQADLFAAEAAGLRALQATGVVQAHGATNHNAYLILEWLELRPGQADARLGEQLAALHQHTAPAFGWDTDNFIGATPQRNAWRQDWPTFWREHRLGVQLQWAAEHGGSTRLRDQGARLLEVLSAFFTTYQPLASLLHGDLWSGNQARLPDGTPVLYDPAVYYGDRETDLAMSELFGGFSTEFYAAYRAAWPLDAGYATRRKLYQLYHLLNHFNLFGGDYAARAQTVTGQLLAEVRG